MIKVMDDFLVITKIIYEMTSTQPAVLNLNWLF